MFNFGACKDGGGVIDNAKTIILLKLSRFSDFFAKTAGS